MAAEVRLSASESRFPRIASALAFWLLATGAAAAADFAVNPVADPAAIVVSGHARFTVLGPRLLRLEWSADGHFEDRASLVFLNRRMSVPRFERRIDGSDVTLRTDALALRYAPLPGTDGHFTPENLTVTFVLNGRTIAWHPGTADTGNLLGTTRTLDTARGSKTKEPIGPGLVSRDGWVVVDDSARPLFDSADFRFDRGEDSPWPWAVARPPGERQDWYFFGYGHAYREALGDYVRVAGRIPLPPRFAFGTWWSRYWAYSDQELDDLARGFRDNDVPLDVLVIDMDWHKTLGMHFELKDASGHERGWTGYSWNPLYFPDPAPFLHHLHEEDLKVTLNLHPASGVQPWEDAYPAMARAVGIDPATQRYVPFDLTDRRFARAYFDLLHHPLEREGVDFWWLDWQQEPVTAIPGLNPTWWLNYTHFTDQEREGKRPLLFHRWGGLGNHRYQIGFSGDTVSVWESLAFQPWFTATAANVGYAYWSHDIGGHLPGAVAPELYLRWIQFGGFSPILRTHTTKNAESERRIWAYPEPYSDLMKEAFHLRYALQPYLYTEARRTYDSGVAFIHPLYYDWPEENEAYARRNEYAFGDELIAAPVTAPVDPASQLAAVEVWIPPGDWMEWPTGRTLRGPVTLRRRFSIAQVPVYVRAGAIIPMQPPMLHTGKLPPDPLVLTVFPLRDGQSSSYELYEDGSDSEAYQHGTCARTAISARQAGDELTVRIAPARGSFPGMRRERHYAVRLPADFAPAEVTANGAALGPAQGESGPGWRFEGNTLTAVISTGSYPVDRPLEIRIRRPAGSLARRPELDGFAGAERRLREAYDDLNSDWPHTRSPDALIDAFQTGDRIGYAPASAEREVARLKEIYPRAEAAVNDLVRTSEASDEELADRVLGLKENWQTASLKDQAAHYRLVVCRAKALLDDGQPVPAAP